MNVRILRSLTAIVLFLLVINMTDATLLGHYLSMKGTVTIMPSEPNVPIHIAQCLNNGWKNYTRLDGSSFENQGLCVSYVATSMCSYDGWRILTRDDGSSFRNQGQCVSYFIRYADDIQHKLNELVLEEEPFVLQESEKAVIAEENVQADIFGLNITEYISVEILSNNNMSYSFLCDNDFYADRYDWYFGDAGIMMDSERSVEHNFTMEGLMFATCYASNSITSESAHATIKVLIE